MDGIAPTPLPTVHSLGKTVTKDTDEKTALRSFEAYVIGEMLRRAVPESSGDGLFDGGQAGRMYRDHLYQEYARMIAETGDFGLSSQLEGYLGDRGSETAREGDAAAAARPGRNEEEGGS